VTILLKERAKSNKDRRERARIDEVIELRFRTWFLGPQETVRFIEIPKSTDSEVMNNRVDRVVPARSDVIIDPPSPLQLKPQHWDFLNLQLPFGLVLTHPPDVKHVKIDLKY
jgi:hypothetical protein